MRSSSARPTDASIEAAWGRWTEAITKARSWAGSQGVGRGSVHRERDGVHDDAVDVASGAHGHELVAHIVRDRVGGASVGVADAAATTADLAQDVAVLDLDHAVGLGVPDLLTALDVHVGQGSRLAATGARWLGQVAVTAAGRGPHVAAQVQDLPGHARAAAPFAGAGEIRQEVPLHRPPREADLDLLDAAALDGAQAGHAHRTFEAVEAGHGAAAAVRVRGRLHVALVRPRIQARQVVAASTAPARDGLVRHRLGQGADRRLQDLRPDVDRRTADGRRVRGVDHGPLGRDDGDRAHRALVVELGERRVHVQEAAGDGATERRGVRAVHEALAQAVAAREVEDQLVALDRRIAPDGHVLVEDGAVVVRGRLAGERPVGDRQQLRADAGLHPIQHLVDALEHAVLAVLVEHRDDPVIGDLERRHQGVVVDLHALREPDVVPDQLQDVRPLHAAVVDLDRRDHDPLGVDVVAVREVPARERAAGVHLVAAGQGDEEQLVVVEDRAEEAPVRQMVAVPLVGIVGEDDVARVQVLHAELVEDVLHREALRQEHRGGSLGHRDRPALDVPDAGRHVVQLGDQVALGGPVDDVPHLATDALEAVPHRGQGDRVDGASGVGHERPPERTSRRWRADVGSDRTSLRRSAPRGG